MKVVIDGGTTSPDFAIVRRRSPLIFSPRNEILEIREPSMVAHNDTESVLKMHLCSYRCVFELKHDFPFDS